MALTRREFMTRTGLLSACAVLGPPWMPKAWLTKALADAIGDRYLVILQTDGGNDGLNTVVPLANGVYGNLRARYESVRQTGGFGLQIAAGDLAANQIADDPLSATPLAFHPALGGFKSLYDAGKLAVLQGCGYPGQNLSHAISREIWQRGDPVGTVGGNTGWMGRYLMSAAYGAAAMSSVNVGNSIAAEYRQTATNVLAFQRLSNVTFPYDSKYASDQIRKRNAYSAIHAASALATESTMQLLGNTGIATLAAGESYPPIDAVYEADRPTWNAGYASIPGTLANDLREVAKVIYAVENNLDPAVCARFFQVRKLGFDTHSTQGAVGGLHGWLLGEVGNAVNWFYNDLDNMPSSPGPGKISDKVLILTWSEFGRRVLQNSSGTDHGTQGPMFAIGGSVAGNVYGAHPDINTLDADGNTSYSQTPADPYRTTDFRDVFGTMLRHWLSVADPAAIFPADSGDPNLFWTVPNFDLGFLP